MFKFMKSKKGFTLVELMIVVVIMAILVAVAVPIFSAVTDNARKKTCIGNQRNIVSQINNQVMSGGLTFATGHETADKITIYTNDKGDALATGNDKGTDGIADEGIFDDSGSKFAGLFSAKNMPFCPTKDGVIEVTVEDTGDGGCKVTVNCKTYESDANKDHVVA